MTATASRHFYLDFLLCHHGPACAQREAEEEKAPEQPSKTTSPFPTGSNILSPEAGSMATGTLAEGREIASTCGELSRLLEVGQEDMAEDVERRKQKY